MTDHLEAAQSALEAQIGELEAKVEELRELEFQLSRAKGALELLKGEGDAAAMFRQPGALSGGQRRTLSPPAERQRRRFFPTEHRETLRTAALEKIEASGGEGIAMRTIWDQIASEHDIPGMTVEIVARQVARLRDQNLVEFRVAESGRVADGRWFRSQPES